MFRKTFVVVFLCILWPAAVQPAIIPGLYEAEVPVVDQSPENHKQGLSSALRAVLIKLTGDRNVPGRPGAASLLAKPEQFVQQYQYQKRSVIEDNQLSLDQELFLQVSFNPAVLDQAMRDQSLPVWGKVRPAALVWLVEQAGTHRQFVGLEDEAGHTAVMDKRAQERGIALLHPVLDQADTSVLKESDVWGGFMEPVRQASARYTADVIVTGNLEQLPGSGWQGRWQTTIQDEVTTWTVTSESAQDVLNEGMDRLADMLASRYIQAATYQPADAAGGDGGIEIIVKDIENFEQYSKVLKYLGTLNSVTNVEVRTVEPGSVTFSLAAGGGQLVVQRAIELGNILESMSGAGGPYRLVP